MASRPNSDKVICRVLEDDFGLPEEEFSDKESDSILSLLETDYRLCRGGNSEYPHDFSTVWYP